MRWPKLRCGKSAEDGSGMKKERRELREEGVCRLVARQVGDGSEEVFESRFPSDKVLLFDEKL